jgi:hypothetical protein
MFLENVFMIFGADVDITTSKNAARESGTEDL